MWEKTKKAISQFLKSESAQATTEYVMFISILVTAVFTVGFAFRAAISRLIETKIGQSLFDKFFNPNSMHRFPFKLRS